MLGDMEKQEPSALERAIIADALELGWDGSTSVLVLDDSSGALTRWALEHLQSRASQDARVFVRSRLLSDAREARRAVKAFGDSGAQRVVVAGIDSDALGLEDFLDEARCNATFVIGHLPKALAALDDIARSVARHGERSAHDVTLVLGANSKHMAHSMNAILEASFEHVQALRGRGKFRCLSARTPRTGVAAHDVEVSPEGVAGIGGVFSGSRPDRGGQLLAHSGNEWIAKSGRTGLRVLDLGCGNGSVSHTLLSVHGSSGAISTVHASDIDADAIRSATRTLSTWGSGENQASVGLSWANAAETIPNSSIDLVLLNPPFHEGTRVDSTLVIPLLDAAQRVLAPAGTMLFVHNSHLRYRPLIEQRFSATRQVERNSMFTVLEAQR